MDLYASIIAPDVRIVRDEEAAGQPMPVARFALFRNQLRPGTFERIQHIRGNRLVHIEAAFEARIHKAGADRVVQRAPQVPWMRSPQAE